MKKWISILLAVILSSMFFSGCSGNQAPTQETAPIQAKTQLPLYNASIVNTARPVASGSIKPTLRPSATAFPVLQSGPYNASSIPGTDIKEALTNAKKDGKLVLLDFGANWCPDCVVLSRLMEDPSVRTYLQSHFHVVKIDVGNWDRNMDIVQEYGNPIKVGIPAVVVLSPAGDVLASTEDGALANARTATAQDILGFLNLWVSKNPQ